MNRNELLKQVFGYDEFREGQATLIDAILSGRDTLGIMPTGAGKSICYQIPALLLPGITLVVSPLISLMKDQVNALTQMGVRAAYLNSSLTERQYAKALDNARMGIYKLIYVAPERLLTPSFQRFVQEAEISLLAVDEAHCVSKWGQDFRPSYLEIAEFARGLAVRPTVCAFTATATENVREDIAKLLEMRDPVRLVTGFDRQNLYFAVFQPSDRKRALLRLMEKYAGLSGIIYCATRKNVEEICESLVEHGYAATRYHAGLSDVERRENQEDFVYDRRPVIVATNAFGMGIDKSNVRFVVHFNMPKDVESYYQEAGRAGRDGERADCVLLYNGQDILLNRFFIEKTDEENKLEPAQREELKRMEYARLEAMTRYCRSTMCYRKFLLEYFGERAPEHCGNCGYCAVEREEVDVTAEARVLIDCVRRTHECFGAGTIVKLLLGKDTPRIEKFSLNRHMYFGRLQDMPEKRLTDLLDHLCAMDCLRIVRDRYPILKLGERFGEPFQKDARLTMAFTPMEKVEEKRSARKQKATGDPSESLLKRLRAVRQKLANEYNVPAFVVLPDPSLRDMCLKQPKSMEEMLDVSGMGKWKLSMYGEAFFQALEEYRRDSADW